MEISLGRYFLKKLNNELPSATYSFLTPKKLLFTHTCEWLDEKSSLLERLVLSPASLAASSPNMVAISSSPEKKLDP